MKTALAWAVRLIPAVIIGQTLPFKFSGHPESVALFSDLSTAVTGDALLEAALRIGTGVMEAITVILLLIPKQSIKGALLVVGTMGSALASHVLFIGFDGHVPLATMAVIALLCSAYDLSQRKMEILKLFRRLK